MVTKAEISLVRSLADKKARAEHGLFVVEGPKMVAEALASGFTVRRVFGLPEFSRFAGFEEASRKDLERMSSLRTPQGVLAVVGIPGAVAVPDSAHNLTLALDGVQDPGNLGTIMRIADWFGIGTILCSEDTADCFNPKAVQASMGAVFRVGMSYIPDLAAKLQESAARGVPVYGTFLDGENIYTAPLTPAGMIVMGSEGNGISPRTAAAVTRRLLIPPYPAACRTSESLNVATATAIVCSEFRRPR